ncbi:MAG: BamA/TamA family outer membrane protein, partial [Phycisphaerales bacterium]
LTLNEDVLGRKTVLSTRTNVNYIPQGMSAVPIYERLFQGGRGFRGFELRGVSPRGVYSNPAVTPPTGPSPDPIGGTFSFFAGAQVEQPLISTFVSGVVFVDSGTVDTRATLGAYRASAGLGVRIYLPMLGQAPLAFDYAFPFLKQPGDQTQSFSFSVDVPF